MKRKWGVGGIEAGFAIGKKSRAAKRLGHGVAAMHEHGKMIDEFSSKIF